MWAIGLAQGTPTVFELAQSGVNGDDLYLAHWILAAMCISTLGPKCKCSRAQISG